MGEKSHRKLPTEALSILHNKDYIYIVCVSTCVRAYVRACVRAGVCVCVCVCVRARAQGREKFLKGIVYPLALKALSPLLNLLTSKAVCLT